MKILAPVNSLQEVRILIEQGAEEIYCGVQPPELKAKSTNSFVNRRTPTNASIKSLEKLEKIINEAHAREVKVHLTLNQPTYRPDLFPRVLNLAREAAALGIDALIIGDPALMNLVKKNLPEVVIHVSSLAGVLNSESVKFFQKLGASRIIFPRYIRLEDLKAIISKIPSIEYEVFILNDGCVFEESYCHINHAFGGAFCRSNWAYAPEETNIRQKPVISEDFSNHLPDYNCWLLQGIKNGGILGSLISILKIMLKGLPLGMCGLCALPELYKMGISSVKIIGRESPLIKKKASVSAVRTILDRVETGDDGETIQDTAKRLKGTNKLCDSKYTCYFT